MSHDQLMSVLQQGTAILVQLAVFVAIVLLRDFKDHVQNYIVAHTTTKQRDLLTKLGHEAFVFAETVYKQEDGLTKLNEATKYVLEKAQGLGLGDIELSDVRAVIEAAWLQDKRTSAGS